MIYKLQASIYNQLNLLVKENSCPLYLTFYIEIYFSLAGPLRVLIMFEWIFFVNKLD